MSKTKKQCSLLKVVSQENDLLDQHDTLDFSDTRVFHQSVIVDSSKQARIVLLFFEFEGKFLRMYTNLKSDNVNFVEYSSESEIMDEVQKFLYICEKTDGGINWH